MHKTTTIRERTLSFWMIVVTLASLLFGYYPLIALGMFSGTHVDISFLYVIVLSTVLVSLAAIWQLRSTLLRFWPLRLLWLFASYLTVSALWSPNSFRALLTAGFVWLLVGLVMVIVTHHPRLTHSVRLLRVILWIEFVALIMWVLWQFMGDSLGITPQLTLLAESYRSSVFGFPRPTGFALEPQFLASLLLIPLAWFAHQALAKKPSLPVIAGLLITPALLTLTLSRGGLLAASLSLIVLALLVKPPIKRLLTALGLVVAGGVLGLTMIAFGAHLNTRDSVSGYAAVQKSVSQLTLGTITLPLEQAKSKSASQTGRTSQPTNGYIASSTTSRTSMAERAVEVWKTTPQTVLFGVGVGGFGTQLNSKHPEHPVSSVVNNYYLEMLAELGIIGLLIFLAFVGTILVRLFAAKQWLIFALLIGFLLQWNFFSGNANVLHLWAVIGIACGILMFKRSDSATIL